MWTTMLVMAIAVIFEPVRIALAILMLNRPRPVLQLLAFVCAGFTICVAFGLVVLFMLRTTPVVGAAGLTVARVQIVVGLLALLVAAVLTANISGGALTRRSPTGAAARGDPGVFGTEPAPPTGLAKLSTRTRDVLQGSSLWVAGLSGLFNLPSYSYMAALAVILASGASPAAQTQALLVFNVAAFTLVGFPLLTYLAAPHKTLAFMAALQAWLRSRRRRDFAVLAAAAGAVMLALGINGL